MADIFEQFKKIQKNLINNFNKAFSTEFKKPMSDISQNSKEVTINIKLPGVNKKDVILDIKKDKINLRAEKKQKKVKKTKKSYSKKQSYSGFYRSMPLPKNLNVDKAKAIFKNNMLTIKIPKLKNKKK